MNIHISDGNRKLGGVHSFSLPAGKSCSANACRTCFKDGCYARKAYRMYKETRNAYDENFELATKHLNELEKQLCDYFDAHKMIGFFRVHVSGDFVSRKYTEMWNRIAAKYPYIHFLVFTKRWNMIRGIDFANNFSVILSGWPGVEIPRDLQKKYPIAYMDDGTVDIPDDALECPGYCESCGSCWFLNDLKRNVRFKKH